MSQPVPDSLSVSVLTVLPDLCSCHLQSGGRRGTYHITGVHAIPMCAGCSSACWRLHREQDKVSDLLELTFSLCHGSVSKRL